MTPFFFHPAARGELSEAIAFYDRRVEGLGREFLYEVEAAIGRVCEMPNAWPELSERVRRCQTRRFPYGILYREVSGRIEIVAVMHFRQHPDTWKRR